MSDNQRDDVIKELRGMAAGRGEGIDLDTPFHWVIENLIQPVPFFQQLPLLLPPDSTLYVEGERIVPEVAAFYSAHRAENAVEVMRDTIAPVPEIYHFKFSPEVLASLRRFADSHPVTDLFVHLKGYKGETLLFTFHDAFTGYLRVSERVPESDVATFCDILGGSRRREKTKRRTQEDVRLILAAIENSGQSPLRGEEEPWYKKIWNRLMGDWL
jgi:hypothetical protein